MDKWFPGGLGQTLKWAVFTAKSIPQTAWNYLSRARLRPISVRNGSTGREIFSCMWISWFLGLWAKPGRGPNLQSKEFRKRPEITSPEPVWSRYQSEMSLLLRKTPPSYRQMNSWGSWPNLVVDRIYKKMWISAKLRIRNVNFLAKNNGDQNFT